VDGFLRSIEALIWVFVVLGVINYAASIFAMNHVETFSGTFGNETFGNVTYKENHFGSLGRSMVTFFALITLTDWDDVVRPIFQSKPVYVLFFAAYTIFVSFGLMNIIIAVTVKTVSDVLEERRTRKQQEKKTLQIGRFQKLLDNAIKEHVARNQMSTILGQEEIYEADEQTFTLEEFIECTQAEPDMIALLEQIDFPSSFTAADLYELLDRTCDHSLTESEIMDGMSQLVYGNVFQRSCLIRLSAQNLMKHVLTSCLDTSDSLSQRSISCASARPNSPAKNTTDPPGYIAIACAEGTGNHVSHRTLSTGFPENALPGKSCTANNEKAARNPLWAAALNHCQVRVARAKRCLELAEISGKHPGLAPGYWSPDDLVFSKDEEEFLVWAQLFDAISKESSLEVQQWIKHAFDIGIEKRLLAIEIAYMKTLQNRIKPTYRSTQPLVEALDRKDWDAARVVFLQTCEEQGANKATLTQLNAKFDTTCTAKVLKFENDRTFML